MKALKLLRLLLSALFMGAVACGQIFTFNGINSDIPDGNLSGLADVQTISGLARPIENVLVTLTISGTGAGAVNGDYYVTLEHNGSMAVLLNRSGLRSGSLIGYDDNGFSNVTFNDSAANGDVHSYRLTLSGDNNVPITPAPSPLTGTWAPDGRNISPLSVIETDSRTQTLSAVHGLDANGTWNLYLIDAQSGGTGRLNGWSVQIAVPEPATMGFWVALSLLGCVLWRKHRTRSG
jgi:hypothetical protein